MTYRPAALRAPLAMLGVAVCLLSLAAPAAGQTWNEHEVAVLQGLDKVTARIFTFDAPLDRAVPFGTLQITVRACRKRPPEEPPESAAFLEIRDAPREQEPKNVFSGWMFASSPALSALEHAVYDVWVLDCRTASSASSPTSQ